MPDQPKRIAVFGDLGGHFNRYVQALSVLGVTHDEDPVAASQMPNDLIVIQVGDLIHRGPDSAKLVSYVDNMLKAHPDQVYQIFGNHEGHYLGGPKFGLPTGEQWILNPDTVKILQRWWNERSAYMAIAVNNNGQDVLITHAGLSWYLWNRCGASDACTTARFLNDLSASQAFVPGLMLNEAAEDTMPGVAWAHPPKEVYETWAQMVPPFGQVHGHCSPVNWSTTSWGFNVSAWVRENTKVDATKHQTTTTINGVRFYGIDPSFGRQASWAIRPLMLTGTVYTPLDPVTHIVKDL